MVLVICGPCGSGKTTIIKDSLKDQTGVNITLPTAEFDDFGSCVLEKLKHNHTLQGITRTQLVLLALQNMKAEGKPPLLFRIHAALENAKLLIHLRLKYMLIKFQVCLFTVHSVAIQSKHLLESQAPFSPTTLSSHVNHRYHSAPQLATHLQHSRHQIQVALIAYLNLCNGQLTSWHHSVRLYEDDRKPYSQEKKKGKKNRRKACAIITIGQ